MKRKSLFVAIALMLVLALVAPSTSVLAAKKKVALNQKKATLGVGQNLKLKVKNTKKKVTWKSSKKAVATVSKKGVVKAKKVGKATITAKVGGKTYKCKIKVKKATPATPKATPLKQLGKNVFIERQRLGAVYVETAKKYLYYYVDIPFSVNASVGYSSTGTTLGSFVGNAKYTISATGKVNFPTQVYYFNDRDEKVYVGLPADLVERYNDLKKDYLDKKNEFRLSVGYYRTDRSSGNTYEGNVTVTDPEFDGYVSTYTNDGTGNFSYTITDVSIYGQYSDFSYDVSFRGNDYIEPNYEPYNDYEE